MKTPRTIFLVVLSVMIVMNLGWGQTTVFSDNFDTSTDVALVKWGPIGATQWSVNGTNDWSARRNNTLDLSNSATWNTAGAVGGGWVFAYVDLSSFKTPYNAKLSSNPGVITWTFNMRTNRSTANEGFGSATTGTAITQWYCTAWILAATENTEAAGDGYAVVMHRELDATAVNQIALFKYTGGIRGTRTKIIGFSPALAATRNWVSVKATYNPKNNEWQLFSRDDASQTALADPETGTITQVGVATVDNAYTSTTMKYFGAYWQGDLTSGRYNQFDNAKVTVTGTTGISDPSAIPQEFKLDQNYPNPFNPSTNITFSVPSSGRYSLKVSNLLGQEIAELLNKELHAGTHAVGFDGSGIPSGIYIYTLSGPNAQLSKAMMLVK
jgi:hypothetical protein